MDAALMTELQALRARAYGRDATVALDSAESERLHELERTLRGETPATPEPAAMPDRPPVPGMPAALAAAGAPRASAEPDPLPDDPVRPAPRPIRSGWIIAWAASVLVVAVGVGSLVFALALASIRPVSTATGAQQVATLSEPIDPPRWAMDWFGQTDPPVVYSYRGLVVMPTPTGVFSDGEHCIFVAPWNGIDESTGAINGPIYSACAAGAFPATVQFVIDDSAPDDLRSEFPDGTALQFVLRDDVVGVFVSEAAPSPNPTA
ncbi:MULTISPECIES: spermidine/putrescine ABC transporter permease [unclassified Microbacterium]|uniref:spermidine/putrescine ABC transporter permease n=1 Tax=unclassified Microbacterium TaxID=2609290 RepID=UPI001AC12E4C|nr:MULTISPECIES: spermidine/putrescine ABC transporter permease [unclassified Microbacterium]MBN9213206.1 spermidine/putrescine ABC transporter permease [Microbacterium sp.]